MIRAPIALLFHRWLPRLSGCFLLLAFCATPAFAALTCQQAVQRLQALNNEFYAKFACKLPAHPVLSHVQTPQGDGPSDHDPPCIITPAHAAAAQAWQVSHQAEIAALNAQKAVCIAKACPSLITPARMAATLTVHGQGPASTTPPSDADWDGIPDSVETALIARFSPFLRFSLSGDGLAEVYPPTDPLWYLKRSDVDGSNKSTAVLKQSVLSGTPSAILGLSSPPSSILRGYAPDAALENCVNAGPRTPYYVTPKVEGTLIGQPWPAIQPGNVGMFAHVSPFVPLGAGDLPCHCPRKINGSQTPVIPPSVYEGDPDKSHYYKIEYFQFFAMNNDFASFEIGDHESDWSILTLVYDTRADKIVSVSHWAHGVEMRFDLLAYPACAPATDPIVGKECIEKGNNNAHQDFNLKKIQGIGEVQDQPEFAQNNEIRFAKDPGTGDYSHPIVYVEYGAHEFWPTQNWGVTGAPSHNGNDSQHSYLAHAIPNLGEIEAPMSDDAAILLGFNGSWGNWNEMNDPPPGPALHKAWNWFVPLRAPIDCQNAE